MGVKLDFLYRHLLASDYQDILNSGVLYIVTSNRMLHNIHNGDVRHIEKDRSEYYRKRIMDGDGVKGLRYVIFNNKIRSTISHLVVRISDIEVLEDKFRINFEKVLYYHKKTRL